MTIKALRMRGLSALCLFSVLSLLNSCRPAGGGATVYLENGRQSLDAFKTSAENCVNEFLRASSWSKAQKYVLEVNQFPTLTDEMMTSVLSSFREANVVHLSTLRHPMTGAWVSTWRAQVPGTQSNLVLLVDQKDKSLGIRPDALIQQATSNFSLFVRGEKTSKSEKATFYVTLKPSPPDLPLKANEMALFVSSAFTGASGGAGAIAYGEKEGDIERQWHLIRGRSDPMPPQTQAVLEWDVAQSRLKIVSFIPDGWGTLNEAPSRVAALSGPRGE